MSPPYKILNRGGVEYLVSSKLSGIKGLVHGVTGRQGGVSQDRFGGLSLAHGVGEKAGIVVENRRFACRAIGFPFSSLTLGKQVHGSEVTHVTQQDRGRGRFAPSNALPDTDGLVCSARRLALGILTADCCPVMFVDVLNHVCGIVHVGWRGLLAGILGKSIEKMDSEFNSKPAQIQAVIGPTIGACCYEIGPELVETISKSPLGLDQRLKKTISGSGSFDIPGSIVDQLLGLGLENNNVENFELCTAQYCESLYSRRVEGASSGRFLSVIGWE